MKLPTLLIVLGVTTLANTSVSAPQNNKARCKEVKAKIRHIEARMRAGYTASQGIRLDRQLRELKQKRYRLCR